MAGESDASLGWSDLPIDLLIHVLGLLDLPEAVAFRVVCPSWRSASKAAGVGASRAHRKPWLVSLPLPAGQTSHRSSWDPAASSTVIFRNLVDGKTFQVSFPRGKGRAVALCGASHGWLVVDNEHSNLVLYNPFTAALVPLPPITSFRPMHLFDKVVLSGSPSAGAVIAFVVRENCKLLSYTRVGDTSWFRVSTTIGDTFADCVHHSGRFYALTMNGILTSWDFGEGSLKPKGEEIIADDNNFPGVIMRYLVSTPWGHLLQVRVSVDGHEENDVKVEIDMLDLNKRKMVRLSPMEALRGYTVFLGQNSPAIYSKEEFPELNLRPDCIYMTPPRLRTFRSSYNRWYGVCNRWYGVKIYDLKEQILEDDIPSRGDNYGPINPSEIWFTPSPLPTPSLLP